MFHHSVQALSSSLLELDAGNDSALSDALKPCEDLDIIPEAFRNALFLGGISKLPSLLDFSLMALEMNAKLPGELVFDLISDAVDASTMEEIERDVWPEVESRVHKLSKLILSTSKQRPQLALLKVANELLKRVSNAVICGKVLLWVANSLPLSDRSGFNSNGAYFVNRLAEGEEGGSDGNKFWKLQYFLSSPAQLDFKEFTACVQTVLAGFEACEPRAASSPAAVRVEKTTRYLKSAQLLPLQLESNLVMRCTMLVQLLFFLRNAVVPKSHEEEKKAWERRALKLLSAATEADKVRAIQAQLAREAVWENWKREKCAVDPPLPATSDKEQVELQERAPTPAPPAFLKQIFAPPTPTSVAPPTSEGVADKGEAITTTWQKLRQARSSDLRELFRLAQAQVPPPREREPEYEDVVEEGEMKDDVDGDSSSKRARIEEE